MTDGILIAIGVIGAFCIFCGISLAVTLKKDGNAPIGEIIKTVLFFAVGIVALLIATGSLPDNIFDAMKNAFASIGGLIDEYSLIVVMVGIFFVVVAIILKLSSDMDGASSKKTAYMIFFGILGVAFILLAIFVSPSSSSGRPDEADIYVIAENAVESRLKSPSTADFCGSYNADISKSGDIWTVNGYVDAQNGFGAMIRSNFTVKIEFRSDNTYRVISCSID